MTINKSRIAIILIFLALAIQVIPTRDLETSTKNSNDLLATEKVPAQISNLLKNTCYDCHSQETKLPWYQKVAPIKWLVNNHIHEGREHLNFSNWNILSKAEKASALDDISDVVSEKEMPLQSYIIMHPEASLSDTDREKISIWATEFAENLFE